MKATEAYKNANDAAEQMWNHIPENCLFFNKWEFYRDMTQDLRAIGRTEEEIWKEFITGAFMDGFLKAIESQIEYDV